MFYRDCIKFVVCVTKGRTVECLIREKYLNGEICTIQYKLVEARHEDFRTNIKHNVISRKFVFPTYQNSIFGTYFCKLWTKP